MNRIAKKIGIIFTNAFFAGAATLFVFSQQAPVLLPPAAKDTITAPLPHTVTYLALGDSYTIGQSVAVSDRFPIQAVSMLRDSGYNMAEADIIATTGWTAGNLLQALKQREFAASYDFVSLLIGVNDQFRGIPVERYRVEFTALLRRSIQLAGNRPDRVVVVSIPDYSVTPFAIGPIDRGKIARDINRFNKVNRDLATAFHVQYLNVTEESRRAANYSWLVATDGLHFSRIEYRLWAEKLAGIMKRSIDEALPATAATAYHADKVQGKEK